MVLYNGYIIRMIAPISTNVGCRYYLDNRANIIIVIIRQAEITPRLVFFLQGGSTSWQVCADA